MFSVINVLYEIPLRLHSYLLAPKQLETVEFDLPNELPSYPAHLLALVLKPGSTHRAHVIPLMTGCSSRGGGKVWGGHPDNTPRIDTKHLRKSTAKILERSQGKVGGGVYATVLSRLPLLEYACVYQKSSI